MCSSRLSESGFHPSHPMMASLDSSWEFLRTMWPALLCICSIFFWFEAISRQTLVTTVAALPYRLVSCSLFLFICITHVCHLMSLWTCSTKYTSLHLGLIKQKILKLQSGCDIIHSWTFWHWLVNCKTFTSKTWKRRFDQKASTFFRLKVAEKKETAYLTVHISCVRGWLMQENMRMLGETTHIKQANCKCPGFLYVHSPHSGSSVNAMLRERASYRSSVLCLQWWYGRNPYCGQTDLHVEQFLSCCHNHRLLF